MPIHETSKDAKPAVWGTNNAEGAGVAGESAAGRGVVGRSSTNYGVSGDSEKFPGVRGTSVEARGVEGWSTSNDGVWGISKTGSGVHGACEGNVAGVSGECKAGRGVWGVSETWQGVFGFSRDNAGIVGESPNFHAIYGDSHSVHNAGVFGTNNAGGFGVIGISENGIGVNGKGGQLAGRFEGEVEITGILRCADVHCPNADCAEDFDIADTAVAEPGTVMIVGAQGALRESTEAYDKRVAGVISGAGSLKPGIVLGRQATPDGRRKAIALLGKTYCKVDASREAIEVGDLLTTSEIPGYAMKAVEPLRAFGAVLGKALQPLPAGMGLIPILIALQ